VCVRVDVRVRVCLYVVVTVHTLQLLLHQTWPSHQIGLTVHYQVLIKEKFKTLLPIIIHVHVD